LLLPRASDKFILMVTAIGEVGRLQSLVSLMVPAIL